MAQFSKVLKEFGWLADIYSLDFFVENHWAKLPCSWKNYFEKCIQICNSDEPGRSEVDLLESIISHAHSYRGFKAAGPAPLSFLEYKGCISDLSMPYTCVKNRRELADMLGVKENNKSDDFTDISKYPKKLLTRIKVKKMHEISRLHDLIDILVSSKTTEYGEEALELIDIGAGVGHLSRIVSHSLNIPATTIEGNSELVERAYKIDSIFSRVNRDDVKWTAPQRCTMYVNEDEEIKSVKEGTRKIVLGLHACGDLSSTIIRHFVSDENARILIVCGCCYHKINCGHDKPFMQKYGYPMSKKFAENELTYASRELACYGKRTFLEKLRDPAGMKLLRTNCYRAILEWVILFNSATKAPELDEHVGYLRHHGLRGIKDTDMGFWLYAREALAGKPEILEDVIQKENFPEVTSFVENSLRNNNMKFLIMYALRLIIAPLVETIILNDRLEFLKENGLYSIILPLFDPEFSPRNHVLVSFK
ncbi:methyltransferase domain-containing protein [Ditylenchus destructor]|nr:methyltransferase domain-containing protein [Ditylenchus destructor]